MIVVLLAGAKSHVLRNLCKSLNTDCCPTTDVLVDKQPVVYTISEHYQDSGYVCNPATKEGGTSSLSYLVGCPLASTVITSTVELEAAGWSVMQTGGVQLLEHCVRCSGQQLWRSHRPDSAGRTSAAASRIRTPSCCSIGYYPRGVSYYPRGYQHRGLG